jgi:hypothetical protein
VPASELPALLRQPARPGVERRTRGGGSGIPSPCGPRRARAAGAAADAAAIAAAAPSVVSSSGVWCTAHHTM